MTEQRSMYVDLKVGQSMTIDGGRIVISLTEKTGQRAQLKVLAAPDIKIERPGASSSGSGARQAQLGTKVAV